MTRSGKKPNAGPKRAAGATKKLASASPDEDTDTVPVQSDTQTLELQQKCLNIFRDALSPSSDDADILQEVKGHLFNRDFATAFGKEEYLRVYASRWSPSRALAYSKTFKDLAIHLRIPPGSKDAPNFDNRMRAVCLGGGAGGELVGLGALLSTSQGENPSSVPQRLHVDLVDIADWSSVVLQLHNRLTTPPELSKYASQAKKDANTALAPASALSAKFHQLDALSTDDLVQAQVAGLLGEADLVTFMFTLNELYSISLPATQALLNRTTETMRPGSLLLVVDSPGSYSTVSLNGAEKKYPMEWLLDHTLLGSKGVRDDEGAKWKKVVEDDSRWFRLSKELSYPIALEDMRFQVHFFTRV